MGLSGTNTAGCRGGLLITRCGSVECIPLGPDRVSFRSEFGEMVQGMAKKRGGEAARGTSGEQAPVVRIFLSSPGDAADERKIARELIEGELQKHPSYRHLKLVAIAWDHPDARIPMLANETPQELVNNARPRPSTCDVVIVILWARMEHSAAGDDLQAGRRGIPVGDGVGVPGRGQFNVGAEARGAGLSANRRADDQYSRSQEEREGRAV